MMEEREVSEYKERDLEQIAVDVVKFLLERNVPYEDIQQLSGKTLEEI